MKSRNSYIDSDQFKAIRDKLEMRLKLFKKSDNFKFIEYTNNYCDNIVNEFKPSGKPLFALSDEIKGLLKTICRLFEQYRQKMHFFELYYEYFNDNKKMNGGYSLNDGRQTPEFVITRFNQKSESLKGILKFLETDANETEVLTEQLGVMDDARDRAMRRGGGRGGSKSNKRKNVKTRRRNKPGK